MDMNAGFTVAWIAVVVVILLATGWQPLLCPGCRSRFVIIGGLGLMLLLPFPLLLPIIVHHMTVHIHVSVVLLLLMSAYVWLKMDGWSVKSYTAVSALLIAFIWFALRRLYMFDPAFHLFDHSLDMALLAAVLTALFTADPRQQLVILAGGVVAGELMGIYSASESTAGIIGSLAWWDSFALGFAAARLLSMLWKGLQLVWAD
jgi:hypothetical protein